ncbi:hypothetical protein EI94DRAFT_1738536 [Lactarius quietus]|nr:hypothetical protein EI94DRAFT_1738536 [Lactarius quietus]
MREKLGAIQNEYRVQPLPAYTMDDRFIEPAVVVDTIAGALVQVQFELLHYHISKRSHDSFNATIAQITVIQPGAPLATLSLKRKNVRNGPLRANPLLLTRNGCSTPDVASTSNLSALLLESGKKSGEHISSERNPVLM